MQIGITLIATAKYIQYVPKAIEGIREYFLTDHDVEIFLFTDSLSIIPGVTQIYTDHKPWPYVTLLRYSLIKTLPLKDYHYYIDVDAEIVAPMGNEILAHRVAITHCGQRGGVGTPERNPISTAYIAPSERNIYVHGGFQGGAAFINDAHTLDNNIQTDLQNNHIAVWHDESHWNRLVFDNPDTKILPITYTSPHSKTKYAEQRIYWIHKPEGIKQ